MFRRNSNYGKVDPMDRLGDILRERNIVFETREPALRTGFVQLPSFILKDDKLSTGAKVTYAMFLDYAWNHDSVFPGQATLAKHIGVTERHVRNFIAELKRAGLLAVKRRGLGKTNIYHLHFTIRNKRLHESREPS